jgi:hypothetical protein
MTMRSESESVSREQRSCGAAAAACRDACREAIDYCLGERGDDEGAAHVRLLRECAEQCERAADSLQQHADADGRLTAATRDLAGRTMRELSERFPEDARLQACADACLRVAERCLSATAPHASEDEASEESFPASDPPPH